MAKSTSNEVDLKNPEISKSSVINSYIGEFMKLKDLVEKSEKKKQYCTNQASKLLESNCNIETNCEKLMLKISETDAKILENTRTRVVKRQELRELRGARTNALNKQWNNCLSEIGNYADNFSQWITEYSRDVLMKDIEKYHDKCKEVGNELAALEREINDMKKKYDSNYIEANVDINNLPSLSTVISDIKSNNNNLIRAVSSTEDILYKIQNKIKQSKDAINEYKIKENTNMF